MLYNRSMKNTADHVLLIGFGGPESTEEIAPFLKRVTAGRAISEERINEVIQHYEKIGGKSSYNSWARQLQQDLSKLLGPDLPVFLGYRNTAPFLKETLSEVHARGLKQGIGVILAPFRSKASCRRYKENIHEALHESGITEPQYHYLSPWYHHPDWIRLLSGLVKETIKNIPSEIRQQTEVLFSCHSIPAMMDRDCSICIYSAEYETSSRLVADHVGLFEWKHVYQSRSTSASQPAWLGPDILETIKQSAALGKKAVLIIPMGFLSENAEVLYDLDIEAKTLAEQLEMQFYRVPTPGNHPGLVKIFAEIIRKTRKEPFVQSTCAV